VCQGEHRQKLSIAKLGKKNPKLSIVRKEAFVAGTLKTWNKGITGYHNSPYPSTHRSPQVREVLSEKSKLAWAKIPVENRIKSDETIQKMSKTAKIRWNNLTIEERWIKIKKSRFGCSHKKTKPEIKLELIINGVYPGIYRYCGDFSFTVNRICPDFVNTEENRVIEMFGDYWHRNDNPQDRIDEFKVAGIDCLVIWEKELKDIDKVKSRLLCFHDLTLDKINNTI
jgi:hypothetical protein